MADAIMRAGGGKQKGAAFEREVCVLLSKWVSGGQAGDVFWRSAMSGGRATVGHAIGKLYASQAGDISCIHPLGYKLSAAFALECKFYAKLDYEGLLTGKGKLLTFWAEANKQAARYKKLPILFARQNRMQSTVCLGREGMALLGLHEARTVLISRPYDLYIILSDKFFSKCKPFV